MKFDTIQVRFNSGYEQLAYAHTLAAIEYGSKWEGMLTLHSGVNTNLDFVIKGVYEWIDRVKSKGIDFYYSTYIHREMKGKTETYHAHIYVRGKHQHILRDMMTLRNEWYAHTYLRMTPPRVQPPFETPYFYYTNLKHKTPSNGAFGIYGIKKAKNEVWMGDLTERAASDRDALKRGEEFMRKKGFSSDWWQIPKSYRRTA